MTKVLLEPNRQKFPRPLDERKLALLKAQEIRNKMFNLVVKIISWETGSPNSLVVKAENKISPAEWTQYKKHQMQIPTTESIEKVKSKINQTYTSISENGGFE